MRGPKHHFRFVIIALLLALLQFKVKAEIEVEKSNNRGNIDNFFDAEHTPQLNLGSGLRGEDDDEGGDDKELSLPFEVETRVEYHQDAVPATGHLLESTTVRMSRDVENDNMGGVSDTVADATEKPEVNGTANCVEKAVENLTGEYGSCERALDDIQSISVMLGRISDKGIKGPRGLKGSKGDMGLIGLPGPNLFKGQKGEKGAFIMGTQGIMGPQGMPGWPGAKGHKGPLGPPGLQGDYGESIVGPAGPPGEKGECTQRNVYGPPGPPGQPGKLNMQEFDSLAELIKVEKWTAAGNLAYVRETGTFYGRTEYGWATLLMQHMRVLPVASRRHRSHHTNRYKSDRPVVHIAPKAKLTSTIKLNKMLSRTSIQLRLVALNSPWTGNMKGIDNINYRCQREAMESKQTGIFRAFLSTSGVDLSSLIKSKDGRIVNLHNNTLYGSTRELFQTGRKFLQNKFHALNDDDDGHVLLYSFDGHNVISDSKWDINMIWHGGQSGSDDFSRNCNGWRTSSTEVNGTASDFLLTDILDEGSRDCSERLIVLCIELSPLVFQEYLGVRPAEYDQTAWTNEGKHLPFYMGEVEYKKFLKDYDSL